ncbi:MAG: phosphatase PAP2 family protein [Actinomycetota bacterium]|nr:phosphatase PAP2 family protein [Actinomycetota bacterium]
MPRQAKFALSGAAAAAVLLILTWLLAFHVAVFRNADQSIYSGFFQLHSRGHVWAIANVIVQVCDPKPFVVLVAVIAVVALLRRRPRAAVAICAIVIGANVTTQLLKPLLAAPRAGNLLGGVSPVLPASWPSGHATAAMTLALCSVIAAPARWRPTVAAVGALFAVAVSYSFLTLGWHYPSDVFGGFLIVACWTLVAVAGVFTVEARRPRRPARQPGERVSLREALAPPAAAVLGGVVLAGLIALARPHQVLSYARAHEAFMVGAAAIALLGLVLATGLMLALRR